MQTKTFLENVGQKNFTRDRTVGTSKITIIMYNLESPHNVVLCKTDHKNYFTNQRFNRVNFYFHLKTIINNNRSSNNNENIS
jgi:hypothetical protein